MWSTRVYKPWIWPSPEGKGSHRHLSTFLAHGHSDNIPPIIDYIDAFMNSAEKTLCASAKTADLTNAGAIQKRVLWM